MPAQPEAAPDRPVGRRSRAVPKIADVERLGAACVRRDVGHEVQRRDEVVGRVTAMGPIAPAVDT